MSFVWVLDAHSGSFFSQKNLGYIPKSLRRLINPNLSYIMNYLCWVHFSMQMHHLTLVGNTFWYATIILHELRSSDTRLHVI